MERVPDSWDQEDYWGADKNSTSVIVPQILQHSVQPISAIAQPKTFYTSELKILKRSSNTTTPPPIAPSAAAGVPNPDAPRKEETEKERRERERKEKERRYKEARDKIFSSPSPTPPEKQQQSKPKAKPSPSPAPAPSPSPPRNSKKKTESSGGGAITGFSLNGGEFSAAPIPSRPARSIWRVDEKMLESQLLISDDVPVTAAAQDGGAGEALEWDSFKRDTCWRAPTGSAEFVPRTLTPLHERDRSEPQVLRAPRGPDIDGGKGFRGRGRPAFVREFVPGSPAWGE